MSQTETREHKIKCDFGIEDYYKYYKKTNDNPVNKKTYSTIVKKYLNLNHKIIANKGYGFRLPQRLGKIELRKFKREIKVDENGKIINKLVVNWKKTNQLWKENPEAKEKKIKIRYTNEHTDGYVFRLTYIKTTANFKNKSIYKMSINREMRRSTENPITSHRVDAFLLNPIR